MSLALYYSKYCDHCKELLLQLSRTQIKKDIHFICIDQRETHKDGCGTYYIIKWSTTVITS